MNSVDITKSPTSVTGVNDGIIANVFKILSAAVGYEGGGLKPVRKGKLIKRNMSSPLADKTLFDLHAVFSREDIGIARES